MKRALLHVYLDTHFIELIRVARLLQSSKRYEVTFFFEYYYDAIERDLKIASAEGFVCLDKAGNPCTVLKGAPSIGSSVDALAGELPRIKCDGSIQLRTGTWDKIIAFWSAFKIRYPKLSQSSALAPLFYLVRTFFKIRSLAWNLEITGWLIYYYHQSKLAKKLITQSRPDVVILAESNIAYATASLTRAAHRCKVPVLIIPFTIANASELAEAYWQNTDYGMGTSLNRFVAKWFPKWALTYKGRRILPLRGAQIVAIELFRLSPPLPWIINSGEVDAIAVESERMHKYYLQNGLPAHSLVRIGALSDDILFRGFENLATKRAKLYEELDLRPELPLIVCSLMPDQIRAGRVCDDFSNYSDLVEFFLKVLANICNYNVIVKLHPRMKVEDFLYIEEYGLKISQWDTTDLIPLCDIYVASVSATIRWAISCAKPVLNYDVYRFRYQDFSDVKGVITVEDKKDFVDTLNRLCNESNFLKELALAQKLEAREWANLDGQSGTRMMQFIDSYIY